MTRAELIALVNESKVVSPAVKALAGVLLMNPRIITDQKVDEFGAVIEQASAAIDRGDWEDVMKIAQSAGLPPAYMTYARNILDAAKPHNPTGQ